MQAKFDFLNWRPDAEDLRNPGLITADNVIHDTEGYKEYKTPTSGAFASNSSLGTCGSVVFRPVGTNGQYVGAWLADATHLGSLKYTANFKLGLFNSSYSLTSTYTSMASATLRSQYTLNSVTSFEVCEYGDLIFMAAEAQCTAYLTVNGTVTLNATGYATL